MNGQHWGTTRLVIQISERTKPVSERMRLGYLRYAKEAGGARLAEKENECAE